MFYGSRRKRLMVLLDGEQISRRFRALSLTRRQGRLDFTLLPSPFASAASGCQGGSWRFASVRIFLACGNSFHLS